MFILLKHISLVSHLRYTSDLMEISLLYVTPGMIKDQTGTPGLETPAVLKLKQQHRKGSKIKIML